MNVCGPVLDQNCAMWCNDSRLTEELFECNTGAFVQIHVDINVSDLIRIDLQTALDRSIMTLHLPVKRLNDNQVVMKVLVLMDVPASRVRALLAYLSFSIGKLPSWQQEGEHTQPGIRILCFFTESTRPLMR